MKTPKPEHEIFTSPEERFNATYRLTDWGECFVRPIFYHGQGTRSYGKSAFLAFLAFPFLAEYCRSPGLVFAWKVWTLMFIIRWLTPDRRQHTGYVGGIRIAEWFSLGNVVIQRVMEVLIVAGCAWVVSHRSVAVSRLMYFGAASLAFQFWVGFELVRRERDAIHNAALVARRYR